MGQLIVKRIVDVTAGLAGTIVTGILFLVLAPAIYIKSPGPIFFKQVRIGKNGRQFDIYKFRSMYMDAEERKKELMEQNQMQGLMFKMKNDPRIIGSEKGEGKGVGNLIRKTSLDEFPQFINVLKGDMSLIGTRPPTLDEYEHYDFHHKARLGMMPGITGLWQVSGRSDILDFEEIVRLDKQYIENWSLWLDWKILFKTFKVVLKGKGAE
jgi:lipopolysaccharide/colanic/teichoic acid biosynthesis glycosyltransferase